MCPVVLPPTPRGDKTYALVAPIEQISGTRQHPIRDIQSLLEHYSGGCQCHGFTFLLQQTYVSRAKPHLHNPYPQKVGTNNNDYRLISNVGTTYKVVAKLLTIHLEIVLLNLIADKGWNQTKLLRDGELLIILPLCKRSSSGSKVSHHHGMQCGR